jgi:cytoskeletal protein RodZ
MKLLNRLSIFILLVVAVSSCNINNGFIQKRKYQKGHHLSMKKKISNSDNSKRKDNHLEQKDELAKENSFSKTSEKSNGAFIETENTSTKNETATEGVAEEAIKNDGNQEKTNRIKTNTKKLPEQIKNVIETQSIVKNNTASKSKSTDDSDLVTLILIILLVILALALFALIDGLLGGLLSLILLIIVVVLLLKYLGVI